MRFRSGLLAGQSLINAMLFTLRKFTVSLAVWLVAKNDIGIILKQWDNIPCKNFTLVALGIQILLNKDKISAKAICNAGLDQDRALPVKQSHSSTQLLA